MVEVADLGLDEGPQDDEVIVYHWLRPLLPPGQVAINRWPGSALPFITINHLSSNESEEESYSDDLISVHVLTAVRDGEDRAALNADRVHRRMLRLARYLEDVPILPSGRNADIESVRMVQKMQWTPYEDEQVFRKTGRYSLGLSYATLF